MIFTPRQLLLATDFKNIKNKTQFYQAALSSAYFLMFEVRDFVADY